MLTAEAENPAALRQLERILASPGFARNARLSRFLRFVVESHLMGKDSELKESLVAIAVFGRSPDYDPKQDSIVRTEAIRLRARLGEYYLGEGKEDPVVIELPKGGYIPVIRPAERGAESVAAPPAAEETTKIAPRIGTKAWTGVAIALLVIALAIVAWWRLRRQDEPIPI